LSAGFLFRVSDDTVWNACNVNPIKIKRSKKAVLVNNLVNNFSSGF